MNLFCPVCIDKQLVTMGKISLGNSNANLEFARDPAFVVKLSVDSIEGRDFECHEDTVKCEAPKQTAVEFWNSQHLCGSMMT